MRALFTLPCLAVLAVLGFDTSSWAQRVTILQDTSVTYRLDPTVDVFIDASNSVSLEQLVTPEYSNRFEPHQGYFTFGYQKSAIWIRARTKTASPSATW